MAEDNSTGTDNKTESSQNKKITSQILDASGASTAAGVAKAAETASKLVTLPANVALSGESSKISATASTLLPGPIQQTLEKADQGKVRLQGLNAAIAGVNASSTSANIQQGALSNAYAKTAIAAGEVGASYDVLSSGALKLYTNSSLAATSQEELRKGLASASTPASKLNQIINQTQQLYSVGRQSGIEFNTMLTGAEQAYDNLGLSAKEYGETVAYIAGENRNTGASTAALVGAVGTLGASFKYLNFDATEAGATLAAVAKQQAEGKTLYKSSEQAIETNVGAFKDVAAAAEDAGMSMYYGRQMTDPKTGQKYTGARARLAFQQAAPEQQSQIMLEDIKSKTGGKFLSKEESTTSERNARLYTLQRDFLKERFKSLKGEGQATLFQEQLAQQGGRFATTDYSKLTTSEQKAKRQAAAGAIAAEDVKFVPSAIGTTQQKSIQQYAASEAAQMLGTTRTTKEGKREEVPGLIETTNKVVSAALIPAATELNTAGNNLIKAGNVIIDAFSRPGISPPPSPSSTVPIPPTPPTGTPQPQTTPSAAIIPTGIPQSPAQGDISVIPAATTKESNATTATTTSQTAALNVLSTLQQQRQSSPAAVSTTPSANVDNEATRQGATPSYPTTITVNLVVGSEKLATQIVKTDAFVAAVASAGKNYTGATPGASRGRS